MVVVKTEEDEEEVVARALIVFSFCAEFVAVSVSTFAHFPFLSVLPFLLLMYFSMPVLVFERVL